MQPTLTHPPRAERGMPGLRARLAWCEAFEAALVAHEAELASLVGEEIGKSAWECATQEFMPLVASLRWHADHAPGLLAPRRIGGAPWWMMGQRHVGVRVPAGRVLIIATWNYPVQLLGIQLAQAVIGGNRVTVKPSERSPRTQALLVRLAAECAARAGLPGDAVTGASATREEGRRLVEEGGWDHVVFTGSTAVGREIAAACARRLCPTTLELSGRDSAIVLADADLEAAAASIWFAATMNAGQTCMAPRRVLVDRTVARAFEAAIARRFGGGREVRLTDPAMAERCVALARAAVAAGGRATGPVEDARDGRLRPVCVASCPRDAELASGDHFGPALALVEVDGIEDALSVHRAAGQHLATAVFTRDARRLQEDAAFVAALGSSVVTFNDAVLPTGHPGTSIEGHGQSGWGPSRGAAGLLALTREVTVSSTGSILRPPVDEPGTRAKAWLRRLAYGGRTGIGQPTDRTVKEATQ
jgi:aldehyde dehydrogenase (NAD+)